MTGNSTNTVYGIVCRKHHVVSTCGCDSCESLRRFQLGMMNLCPRDEFNSYIETTAIRRIAVVSI